MKSSAVRGLSKFLQQGDKGRLARLLAGQLVPVKTTDSSPGVDLHSAEIVPARRPDAYDLVGVKELPIAHFDVRPTRQTPTPFASKQAPGPKPQSRRKLADVLSEDRAVRLASSRY